MLRTPGGRVVGQSVAIANYTAHRASMHGAGDDDFALSQMCLAEGEDLYSLLLGRGGWGGDRRDGARQCVQSREGPSVEDPGDVLPQRVLRNRMMRGADGDCADATHRAGSGSASCHRRSHVLREVREL